ncbi:MAG TPA: hypothetical protein VD966_06515 [Pyrinomonadaceae bacterium]|nr:hypothetical protein [Pyrinomonadaceae bacterium]
MIRKQIINTASQGASLAGQEWLNLEHLARVEITSEDAGYPVESALLFERGPGWRAAQPGEQTIRIVFDQPQRLRRIRLVFREAEMERAQEFVLRWSPEGAHAFREIVRQQWNFSPGGATLEVEDYRVDLQDVKSLELLINPDRSGGQARASLEQFHLA